MSAILIGKVVVHDEEKFNQYAEHADSIVERYEGKLLFLLQPEETTQEQVDSSMTVILEFPSSQLLHDWEQSAEYQALIPMRNSAADVEIIRYESVM